MIKLKVAIVIICIGSFFEYLKKKNGDGRGWAWIYLSKAMVHLWDQGSIETLKWETNRLWLFSWIWLLQEIIVYLIAAQMDQLCCLGSYYKFQGCQNLSHRMKPSKGISFVRFFMEINFRIQSWMLRPLFSGRNVSNQLSMTCSVLGCPTMESWPGLVQANALNSQF